MTSRCMDCVYFVAGRYLLDSRCVKFFSRCIKQRFGYKRIGKCGVDGKHFKARIVGVQRNG